MEQKARMCAEFTAGQKGSAMGSKAICSSSKCDKKKVMDRTMDLPESTDVPPSSESLLVKEPVSTNCSHSKTHNTGPNTVIAQANDRACDDITVTPCKLLSLLAQNPAADITQIPIRSNPAGPPQDAAHDGGIECGKAYEMLMQYATSEDKMDYVARALERGCSSTGKGSCAIKKNVVWGVLDEMCG
jgi:hypothetical protein